MSHAPDTRARSSRQSGSRLVTVLRRMRRPVVIAWLSPAGFPRTGPGRTLDGRWAAWFGGLQVQGAGAQTVISGLLAGQPGLLDKIGDLGLCLISVRRLDPDEPETGGDAAIRGSHHPLTPHPAGPVAPSGDRSPRSDIPPGRHLRVTPRGGRDSYRFPRARP